MGLLRRGNEEQKVEFVKEEKPGILQRLRETDWKNPVNRWKLSFTLIASFVFMIVFMVGAMGATSTNWFCMNGCHSMAPEAETFKVSAHSEVQCIKCHIPPGPVTFVMHKMGSMKEMYAEFTGFQPEPIAMHEPISNESCMRCHSQNRLVTASGDIITNHEGHIKKEVPCVSCHAGTAHGKIVERGLNGKDTWDLWNADATSKIMSKAVTGPNMGTCINCHTQVNAGKEPWKEELHSEGKESGSHASIFGLDKAYASGEEKKTEEDTIGGVSAQTVILQTIGKQKANVKISQGCKTCHLNIETPETHKNKKWQFQHGVPAEKTLPECINCHSDSKWIKSMPREEMTTLLDKVETTKPAYKPSLIEVKTESRDSKFCSSCHSQRPVTHGDDASWLTAHPNRTKTDKDIQGCLVCHDYNKIENSNAPTDVYCKFCHRTGLEQVEKNK